MLYELYFKNECVIIHVYNFFTFIFSSTPAGKRFLQLQQQVEVLQEENFKLETGKTRIILIVCEFDVKLNHTNNELMERLSQVLFVWFHLMNVL